MTKIDSEQLDLKDKRILEILLEKSNLRMKDIMEEILEKYPEEKAIPPTTIQYRINQLLDKKIISKFSIELNKKKLYGDILSFILISVSSKEIPQRKIVDQLMEFKEVEEVAIVTGDVDLLVQLRVKSIDELNKFILDELRNIDGIGASKTMISLEYKLKDGLDRFKKIYY